MSFGVVLYTNSSSTKVVDKQLTAVLSVSGSLRDGASVLDPEILIETDLSDTQLGAINYMYVQAFHRYYFVTDMRMETTGLWLISGHVDVLMTYRAQIRNQNAIVARQEGVYNMYLDDGWFTAYQKPLVFTHPFSISSPFATHSYVLIIAGS